MTEILYLEEFDNTRPLLILIYQVSELYFL